MNKIKLILAAVLFTVGFGVTTSAQAQATEEMKIGYVNPQAILVNMPEFAAVEKRLENFSIKEASELRQKEQAFQTEVVNYQQKMGVISAEAQAQEQERLGQMQNELLQASNEAERAVQAKEQELIAPLLSQIATAINVVAERMELTYVLNTTTSTGDMVILYVAEDYASRYNITQSVMEELGMFE